MSKSLTNRLVAGRKRYRQFNLQVHNCRWYKLQLFFNHLKNNTVYFISRWGIL